jgi:hypothetical protein
LEGPPEEVRTTAASGGNEPLRRSVERLAGKSGGLELASGETLAQDRVEAKIGE